MAPRMPIAQGIRSTVGALTSANQQLGDSQGLLSTTMSGLNNISNTMTSMRDVLVKLSDSSVTGADRTNYAAAVHLDAGEREDVHSGRELRRQDSDRRSDRQQRHVRPGRRGAQRSPARPMASRHSADPRCTVRSRFTSTTAGGCGDGGGADHRERARSSTSSTRSATALNTVGSETNYVNNQVSYNSDKIDCAEHRPRFAGGRGSGEGVGAACSRCKSGSSLARNRCRSPIRRRRHCLSLFK